MLSLRSPFEEKESEGEREGGGRGSGGVDLHLSGPSLNLQIKVIYS